MQECKTLPNATCRQKYKARCVIYHGPNLPCIGTYTYDNLQEILIHINEAICNGGSGSAGWKLTGNTITGSEYLGTNNDFPLNFYTNGLNVLTLSNTPAQLYLKGGVNPLFSMKQSTSNQEYHTRIGDGTGLDSNKWNIYDATLSKIRVALSGGTFIVGNTLSPYTSSSVYVSSTSSSGANIDAQPDGILSDEANIEAMKSDYSSGEGLAMRVWGSTGVGTNILGYLKQDLGVLDFNNQTNIIRTATNTPLRIGTNDTERITILGNGNIGLNEISPTEILHVNGTPRFVTGNEGLSKVWTSDANGVGDWVTPASPSTPTLQQVTDVGNTTTNDIVVADNRVIIFNDAGFGNIELTDAATVLASYNTSGIQYRVGSFYQSFESAASTINNISNTLPDISGILVLSVNGNTADSSGEITLPVGLGTVTSVDMNVPTGFAISGNPITTSGTLALAFDTGYSLPTDASQADWDTAFGWGDWSTGVDKTFVDALNVDADTLDGIDSTGFATPSSTTTFTNKRWVARVGSTTSSATPTINTDNVDIYKLTAQAADITSFTTNLSGTPNDGDILEIQITGTAARAIAWGASFVSTTVTLPTTTVTTITLTVILQYYTTSSYGNNLWHCVNYY